MKDINKERAKSDIEITSDLFLATIVDMFSKLYAEGKIAIIDRKSDDVLCHIINGKPEYKNGLEPSSTSMKLKDVKWSSDESLIKKVYVQPFKELQVIDISRK